MRRVAELPVTVTHRIKHCQHGGKAAKPTRLLAVRLPTLRAHLAKWTYNVVPSQILVGKNADGTWKTAQAKEYPVRLSAAIAASMMDAARAHRITRSDVQLTKLLQDISQLMLQLMEDAGDFAADFVDAPQLVHSFDLKWQPPTGL